MLKNKYIFFDFAGTLVKMRPPILLPKEGLLKDLVKKFNLGIITGARKTETLNILQKLGISYLFKTVVTKDDSLYQKPDSRLFPNEIIIAYVGDTKKDEVFAKNAYVAFFRVSKRCKINDIINCLF